MSCGQLRICRKSLRDAEQSLFRRATAATQSIKAEHFNTRWKFEEQKTKVTKDIYVYHL